MKSPRLRMTSGFTLAEVLLATVILSFGLVAVSRAMLKAYEAFGHSSRVAQAARLLEETMDDMMIRASEPEAFGKDITYSDTGTYEHPNEAYSWSLEVKPSDIEAGLRIAEVEVSWIFSNRRSFVSATSLIEVPVQAPPTPS